MFTAFGTTTFGPNATLASVGLSNNPVTLQSSVNGNLFTWTKAAGGICADYTYIRDSRAMGGAYFEAGRNGANDQGNNPGWSFGFVPRASYVNRITCPNEGAHTLRLDFTAYDGTNNVAGLALATAQFPLALRVYNRTANTFEDVSVPATPYYYPIPNSTADTQYQVVSLSTTPNSGCGATTNTDLTTFPVVTDAILAGPAGTWSGSSTLADGNWLDCHNWASGTLPAGTTDAVLNANGTAVSLGNSLTTTISMQPTLNGPGATMRALTIPAGGTLTLGSSCQVAVTGNWVNNGTLISAPTSQVTFSGTSTHPYADRGHLRQCGREQRRRPHARHRRQHHRHAGTHQRHHHDGQPQMGTQQRLGHQHQRLQCPQLRGRHPAPHPHQQRLGHVCLSGGHTQSICTI